MTSESGISRRAALLGLGAAGAGLALAGTTGLLGGREIPGDLLGASSDRGHRLRDGPAGSPNPIAAADAVQDVGTLIIGGGVAGLSAARRLLRAGRKDFALIELEDRVGGKSVSGENRVSRWPWGAHYLPVPSTESDLVRELLEELGVITGYTGGVPRFDAAMLCHEPHARLFIRGRWQSGLTPSAGLDGAGRRQVEAFRALMAKLRSARGADGRRIFGLPVGRSSADAESRGLDDITFAKWAEKQGFVHPDLRWYLDYCCRDDYGVGAAHVSAWAGIHYFAGRDGRAAVAGDDQVLTWPEGNAWLVGQLRAQVKAHIRTGVMATRVAGQGEHVRVDAIDFGSGQAVSWRAGRVIWAAPQFIARHVVAGLKDAGRPAPVYAPWMVANLKMRVGLRTPLGSPNRPGVPVPLCWDNVIRDGASLGYVNANHQHLAMPADTVNLTLYWPMDTPDIDAGRKALFERSHGEWVQRIVAELELAHPGVRDQLERVDVWRWGHGMVVPRPGAIWTHGPALTAPLGRLHFAHSDLSGISNFEEAQHHGDRAAREVLAG